MVFNKAYEREMGVWLKGKSDIFVQVYAACMQRQQYSDTAEREARAAVEAYKEKFPEPVWPGEEDE